MPTTPVLLIILDGFGHADDTPDNAIARARKPNLDRLLSNHPHTLINASESYVGLPDGQMGNSEVGHLNMGAGRIVYQELTRISKDIRDGGFFKNKELLANNPIEIFFDVIELNCGKKIKIRIESKKLLSTGLI